MTEIQILTKKLDELTELVKSALVNMQITGTQQVVPCSYTLHSWLDYWLATYKLQSVTKGTYIAYEVAVRLHIKPKITDTSLNLLSGLDLQNGLLQITSGRTRKACFDLLKESLTTARHLKLISDNPTEGVKLPTHTQLKGSPLSPAEQDVFLYKIQGHALEDFFALKLYTGCRRSELLNLKISDIDFEKKQIHIRGTKTKGSNRTIPLFEKVAKRLNKMTFHSNGFLFIFSEDYVTHIFKKFCPNHKLHDLRHTFATNCLNAKIPLKVVQKWLGHSKLDTTADIYSHVLQELETEEAQILDEYLAKIT
jgi:integrase